MKVSVLIEDYSPELVGRLLQAARDSGGGIGAVTTHRNGIVVPPELAVAAGLIEGSPAATAKPTPRKRAKNPPVLPEPVEIDDVSPERE